MNEARRIFCSNPKPSYNETALGDYKKSNAKKVFFIMLVFIAIILLGMLAVVIGPLDISVKDAYQVILHKLFPLSSLSLSETIEGVVWFVRIPRFLTGLLVGCSLAIAGAVMQPVLRNPMASPFTLGISSGASFGAALAIICGLSIGNGAYFIVANAFLFALLTSFIILTLAKIRGAGPEMMILSGIALSYLFHAVTTFMEYFADSMAVNQVIFWAIGSLSKGTWETLECMLPFFIVCVPYLILKSWDLNIIGAGDDAAKSLGIDVEKTRLKLMIVASLLTAATVCFTGTIAFIGLVAPHITRMIIGGDNRFVIPASGLLGALLLAGSDIIAVNIIAPVVIPIGVMTSFIGAPLFIYLIVRMKRRDFS